MDEQQLSALINAAVQEAVQRTTAELSAQFETATAGLRLRQRSSQEIHGSRSARRATLTPVARCLPTKAQQGDST